MTNKKTGKKTELNLKGWCEYIFIKLIFHIKIKIYSRKEPVQTGVFFKKITPAVRKRLQKKGFYVSRYMSLYTDSFCVSKTED